MTHTRTAGWIAAFALLASPTLAGNAAATEEMETTPAEAVQAEAAEASAASEFEEPMANGHVARATFTTGVADREPQDEVTQLGNDHTSILFFTDLRGLQGQTVTHVWERNGQLMAKVPFAVGAPRWRVYSSKNLEPSWTGEWTVKVVDESGQVIHAEYFEYVAAAATETHTETPPASMPME